MVSEGAHYDVAVVGGGISGLAAAHELASIAPGIRTALIESENRLGGKILTEQQEGFTMEAGPDSFLASKPSGLELCRQLGLEGQLETPNQSFRRTYVMRDGRLYPMPEGLTGLIPARLTPIFRSRLLSTLGKLRLGLDYALPARRDPSDESLGDFVERRLGKEVYERLIEPLMAGIYAGNGKELSLAATFPQLRSLEVQHRSLLRGIRSAARETGGPVRSANQPTGFLALRKGMAQMVEALTVALGTTRTLCGLTVSALSEGPSGYQLTLHNGEVIHANAVILAIPAFEAARLMELINSYLSGVVGSIPYASTATVYLAYSPGAVPFALDGYGYIVPRKEGRPVLACTWTSTKFPERAPAGHTLIRIFLGRRGQEEVLELEDAQLLDLAKTEVRQTLGIQANPDLWRLFRWPKAMPQYTLGHTERLATIERGLKVHPGLFLAGSAYRGVGVPDCIASGEWAALAARDTLAAS